MALLSLHLFGDRAAVGSPAEDYKPGQDNQQAVEERSVLGSLQLVVDTHMLDQLPSFYYHHLMLAGLLDMEVASLEH